MNELSVVILTFNSQKYLKKVLESVSFANEILIIDSGSKDESKKIAKGFANVRFIYQKWLGFAKQKQFGVDKAKNDWVFVLDSDEVMSKSLEDEILNELKNPKFRAYKVARLNYFFDKPIKTMGLYPDYTIRLFDKKMAAFTTDRKVHESVKFDGRVGVLKSHFLHFAYTDIEQFIAKQNLYSTLGAKKNRFKALFSPCWTFFKLFILKGGFKDGWDGFIISKLYAQYTFWKYIK